MRTPVDAGRLPGMVVEHVLGGRYRLIDQLGTGGMAIVWRAHDQVLDRTVAVKLLAGRHVDDPQSRELIRAEARAAAALSHPNIAQVHDYGEAQEGGNFRPYVVMELVRGSTLEQRMGAGPVAPRFAMRVSAEVAAALAAAHADGLVHRDIKPANVMLTPVGAKVVDFGIAAAIGPGSAREEFEVLGTPAYLAPERLSDDSVSPACDVYALGLLLYRLLSGELPWSVDSTTQMLTAHIYIEPTPLPQLPGVPEYVTTLCNRCLSKDPTLRPSAREAAAVLAEGAGMRVVEDQEPAQEPAQTPAGPAVDREPSLLIRRKPTTDSRSLWMDSTRIRALAAAAAGAVPPAGPPTWPPAPSGPPPNRPPSTPAPGGDPRHAGPPSENPDSPSDHPDPAPAVGAPAPSAAESDPSTEPDPPSPLDADDPVAPRPSATATADTGSPAPPLAPPVVDGPRRRRTLLAAVAIVLISAGALLWLFLPRGGNSGDSAAVQPNGVAPASAAPTPSKPQVSGATPSPGSVARTPPGATATGGAAGPGAGAGTGDETPGGTAPADTGAPDAPGDPATTSTTTPPDTTPVELTLSSDGGTVRATCPAATTAELLSWTPTKPYKLQEVDAGPATAAAVVFRHGNRRVQMTVTCSAGVPSTSNQDV